MIIRDVSGNHLDDVLTACYISVQSWPTASHRVKVKVNITLVQALRLCKAVQPIVGVENRKSTTYAICCLKSVLREEKRRTGSDSGGTNATKTVSDVFRHRSRTRKSFCRTKSDVGSERVNWNW
jgi:hypothetical protein